MTSCQKPRSRCRCMFASGSVASGAASGNAFGKSTLSYFCFRFLCLEFDRVTLMEAPEAFKSTLPRWPGANLCSNRFRFASGLLPVFGRNVFENRLSAQSDRNIEHNKHNWHRGGSTKRRTRSKQAKQANARQKQAKQGRRDQARAVGAPPHTFKQE